MCTTCGCGSDAVTIDGGHAHDHSHGVHDHSHGALSRARGLAIRTTTVSERRRTRRMHHHHDAPRTTISLEQDVLAKNQLLAERNRGWFAGREVFAVNLMSSPGSGKTSILERTIRDLAGRDSDQRAGGRPGHLVGCRPHPCRRRRGGANQHRHGLPSRRPHGGAWGRAAEPAARDGADDRECRQPGLPRPVRSRRERPRRRRIGNGRRRQAAEVSSHVPVRPRCC